MGEESEEDSTPPTSPAPPVARRKFDDEESEEDVLDDWEAAEDSEVEREKAKKAEEAKAKAAAEAKANHKPKTKRIEDRIAERKRLAAEAGETSEEDDDETEAERRARLRATEKDADLRHAEDLFGDLQVTNNRKANKPVTLCRSQRCWKRRRSFGPAYLQPSDKGPICKAERDIDAFACRQQQEGALHSVHAGVRKGHLQGLAQRSNQENC